MLFAWFAFLLLVCCTCVISRLIVDALVFFTERFFVMKINNAFHFVFCLRTSVHYFLFSSLILSDWCLFNLKPDMNIFQIHLVTSTLATFAIANGLWMVKILVLKLLDCRFHDENFFQRIQNMISHEYILQTLLMESKYSNNSTILEQIRGAIANMRFLVCTRVHTICDALDNRLCEDEYKVENIIFKVYKNLTNNELR